MLVLVDESGCTGFKQGSSTHFVIGMVVFDTFKDAEEAANIINKLKLEVGFKREFRFSSCDNRKRDMFFEAVMSARFKVRIFVVEKKLIYSQDLRKNDELFANYCLKCLMKSACKSINNATFKIDGKGSKYFRHACKSYLRKEVPHGVIKDIKFANSQNDVLIQLADMVISAFSRPYNNPNKTDAYKWRNIIESKVENVWNFK